MGHCHPSVLFHFDWYFPFRNAKIEPKVTDKEKGDQLVMMKKKKIKK
jgi:hypothetical protein